MTLLRAVVFGFLVLALGACANSRENILHDTRSEKPGPDEFSIIPAKPLSTPVSYAELPEPTPGGSNLTDQNPIDDAIVALGGRPTQSTGVPSSDGGMVQYVSRFGVPGDIRAIVASDDEAYRAFHGRFTRLKLFKTDRYANAYRRQQLDAYEELQRWRRVGVSTPTAPPGF